MHFLSFSTLNSLAEIGSIHYNLQFNPPVMLEERKGEPNSLLFGRTFNA